ncbi:MAG: S8 family serine peptidase [Bacteroidota bacterium]
MKVLNCCFLLFGLMVLPMRVVVMANPECTVPDQGGDAQGYWVYLVDKEGSTLDPDMYFTQAARERRARLGLPAYDHRDLPLTPSYVQRIAAKVDRVRHEVRWLNAVTVMATASQISQVAAYPFIASIEPFMMDARLASMPFVDSARLDTLLSLSRNLMQLDMMEQRGLTGKGVRIAILDAGFKEADTHPALAQLRERGGIIGSRDFYDGDEQVYHHSRHGMEVMSCIAGMYGKRQLGCAKDASFLLARIEHERKEPAIEEDHWLAAAEWADRMGADIINSSITYTFKRYTYEDMDGKTAPVSKAARIASEKGMLVVCAMGNEGADSWRYLGAPADVPEVLSVGGVLPILPQHIPFASVGPNAEKQLKPDVAAPGFVLSAVKKGKFDENAGTSFSTPLVTGIAACLLQRTPNLSPSQLASAIRQLGHFYPYFDYELGYGVPQMTRLFEDSRIPTPPRYSVFHRSDSVILAFDTTYLRTDSLNFPNGRMLYFHLESSEGYLYSHQGVRIPNKTQFYFFRRMKGIKGTLRIWMGGYLYEEEL